MDDRNKAIFSLIYQMNIADSNFNKMESRYLINVGNTLGLSQEEMEQVLDKPNAYALIPPANEQERMEILYYMLFSMRIDGNISRIEEAHVYKAGLKLGFNEAMVSDMINLFKQYLKTRLPKDALIKIIRKYLN